MSGARAALARLQARPRVAPALSRLQPAPVQRAAPHVWPSPKVIEMALMPSPATRSQ